MAVQQTYSVLAVSKRSFTINSKWEHGDYTGLLLKGQDIKCEKKLPKALQHAKSKIEADNCDELDITVLTFALMNSSHQLMEREPEEQVQSVSKLRKIRNAQYRAASDFHMTDKSLLEVLRHMMRFTRLCLSDQTPWCQHQIDEVMLGWEATARTRLKANEECGEQNSWVDLEGALLIEAATGLTGLEANFVVFNQPIVQLLPIRPRMYFKRRWNAKYPAKQWQDAPYSGMLMMHGSPDCTVDLDGSATARSFSGKVLTTTDLTNVLVDGDKVQLDGCATNILSPCSEQKELHNQLQVGAW
jgi:hypothetical protein